MNKYFDIKDKVYDVTEKYPELIEVLANAGFEYLYERHIIHKQNNIDKYNFLYITKIFLIHIQINS